jgi:O-antigen/teichoic acid export membrane protein
MSTNQIQHRALNNSLIGSISFIFYLVQNIILVPVLLKYWGHEKYGVWLAIYAAYSLLQSLDTGHINYIGNKINIAYHIDKDELRRTLASSLLMAIIIGLLQILLVIFLIVFNYLPNFIGIDSALLVKYEVPASLLIMIAFWFISGSIGGILHRIMIPTGFYYQAQCWGIIYRFCQFLSIIIVAIAGGSILNASIFYVFIQLIVYALTFLYIKIKIPEFYPWWKGISIKIAFINFKNSLVLTFNSFIQQLNYNGIVLLISNLFSTNMIPVFTTIRTMTNTALSITNLLINSILPDFIRYHAGKEKEKLYSVFNANWFFSGMIVNIGIICFIPFAQILFRIWTKGFITFDYKLFISLAASISVINFGAGFYNYLFAINSLRAVIVITITRVIILFSLSYYFSKLIGLSGVGVAVMISEIFSSMILPYFYVQKILKSLNGSLDLKTTITAAFSPLILIVFAALTISGIEFNYYIWGVALLLIIIIYIFNWSILDKEVKKRAKNLIHSLF